MNSTSSTQIARPILFRAPMVRAILAGRKTQTRRIVKDNSVAALSQAIAVSEIQSSYWQFRSYLGEAWTPSSKAPEAWVCGAPCPYGSIGDRLWVRETHYAFGWWTKNGLTKTGRQKWKFHHEPLLHTGERRNPIRFNPAGENFEVVKGKGSRGYFKRPSIHMPRWASRITLEITKVRVERLQDISEEDAKAEGILMPDSTGERGDSHNEPPDFWSYKQEFAYLWDAINGKGAWDKNPWVWVIEFRLAAPSVGLAPKSDGGSGYPQIPLGEDKEGEKEQQD